LDLSAVEPNTDRRAIAELVAQECDVTLGPFLFRPSEARNRWRIQVSSPLGNPSASIKLDVGPPCWLQPEERDFVPTPISSQYGFALPSLPSMRLEEILAEKVARLSRLSAARDASDLVWAATTAPHFRFSHDLVRRVAVLKVWVDNHGLRPGWTPALAPSQFDPELWFSPRNPWDDEQIGLITHPPPPLDQLEADLGEHFSWLRDLTDEEARWAQADPNDRGEVIDGIRALEHSALKDAHIW
jgi:hypothetical protein